MMTDGEFDVFNSIKEEFEKSNKKIKELEEELKNSSTWSFIWWLLFCVSLAGNFAYWLR